MTDVSAPIGQPFT